VTATNHWQAAVAAIPSRGSTAARPGSLAGLAAARREHQGQFFTPEALSDYVWRYVKALRFVDFRGQPAEPQTISLFDNSCGTGRLFRNAEPGRHILYGCDVDADAINALSEAAVSAGIDATFIAAGMELVRPPVATVGIINPPFGLNFQSPFLIPSKGVTAYGRFGPDTSALSQAYALVHALDGCRVVFAILPETFATTLPKIPCLAGHLRAIIKLPSGLFAEEGTDVRVSLAVLSSSESSAAHVEAVVDDLAGPIVDVPMTLSADGLRHKPPRNRYFDESTPSITLPVTGDRTVRVVRSGHRIVLKFACGLVEAKVRNAILRERIVQGDRERRLPKGVEFTGQGLLDIEAHLFSEGAQTGLETVAARIRNAGGHPVICDSLKGYYRHRLKQDRLRHAPLRRWVNVEGAPDLSTLDAGARFRVDTVVAHVVDLTSWGGPAFIKGRGYDAEVTVDARGDRTYRVWASSEVHRDYTAEELLARFRPALEVAEGWRLLHAGRRIVFPERAAHRTRLAEALGLRGILSWQPDAGEDCYQFEDVVELSMAPRGVLAWDMALGKGRAAIALALLGGQRNLIVVESHLVPELETEFEKMGIDRSTWQVIESPAQLKALRRVNVISYARLRRPVERGSRKTYACMMRRRLHTVVADEAELLSNEDSQQVRALWKLSPKRRYALSGTAIGSYCRNALPLLFWAAGDGMSYQVYGNHRPFICEANVASMAYAERGIDVFRDRHVTLDWAVREFEDSLKNGAKREVPRLRNVETFREWLAPHLLRRVLGEPEVERWIKVKPPVTSIVTVDWDHDHLRKYLKTAWEFANWYREQKELADRDHRNINHVTLLARIGEVCLAANAPSKLKMPGVAHRSLTSKQRWCVARIAKLHAQGRKTIVFGTNPSPLRQMAAELDAIGIRSVVYAGDTSIATRTAALNREFRNGKTTVVFITYGSGRKGLNLPQATRIICYNRVWTPKEENQAIRRAVRPQQLEEVECEFVHLAGSIDEYMAQMTAHKKDSIDAGVDYADQLLAGEDFLHIDTILSRFCKDLRERFGVDCDHHLMEMLESVA